MGTGDETMRARGSAMESGCGFVREIFVSLVIRMLSTCEGEN